MSQIKSCTVCYLGLLSSMQVSWIRQEELCKLQSYNLTAACIFTCCRLRRDSLSSKASRQIGQASSSHNQSSLVLWFCQILHYHIFTCCRLRRDPVVVKSKQTKNSCFAARASSSSGPGLCSGGRRSRAGTGLLLWDQPPVGEIRLIWEFPQLLLCFWLAGPRASAHTE